MSMLKFEIDWAAAPGGNRNESRDPIDHTFAHLRIRVGEKSILTVLDKEADTTRDWLFVPVYPAVEWVVANWWRLLEEPQTGAQGALSSDYAAAHSFRHVGRGYAYPDVRLIPEGELVRIEWHPLATKFHNVDFLLSGEERLRRADVEEALHDLVRTTLSRLDTYNMADTSVHQDWAAILGTSPAENDFCRAAGWLGLDPYDMDDGIAQQLTAAWGSVAESLRVDFFQATTIDKLSDAAAWVSDGVGRIRQSRGRDGAWRQVRSRISAGPEAPTALPWEQGYQMARQLRAQLGLADRTPLDLGEVLGSAVDVIPSSTPPPSRRLEAIVATNPADAVCCYTAKTRVDSQRFLAARAVLDLYFGELATRPVLLTPASTGRQQRSRAFAAELLAPAELIARRLQGDEVDEDEVEDLAGTFQVSTEVIRRQIQNHKLARLAWPL